VDGALRKTMILFQQAVTAALLVALTLCLQCAGIATIIQWLKTGPMREVRNLPISRSAVLVMETTIAVISLQGLIILVWAGCYRWLCLNSWESAFYFSAASYSTVGYGDVVLPLQWRLLGPLESMMGVLMCGISVSLLFALINKLIANEVRVQPGNPS
jgi:voltage-gated potassium channel